MFYPFLQTIRWFVKPNNFFAILQTRIFAILQINFFAILQIRFFAILQILRFRQDQLQSYTTSCYGVSHAEANSVKKLGIRPGNFEQ